MALEYHIGERGAPGFTASIVNPSGSTFRSVIPAMALVDSSGNEVAIGSTALGAGTDRSGTATTTSGGLNVAANSARKGLVGQNTSAVNIGFNEFGGTAAIGSAGTYTVAAGQSFSISTNRLVNFIAASGTAAVTLTEY
jgi:hypothetical protein